MKFLSSSHVMTISFIQYFPLKLPKLQHMHYECGSGVHRGVYIQSRNCKIEFHYDKEKQAGSQYYTNRHILL